MGVQEKLAHRTTVRREQGKGNPCVLSIWVEKLVYHKRLGLLFIGEGQENLFLCSLYSSIDVALSFSCTVGMLIQEPGE